MSRRTLVRALLISAAAGSTASLFAACAGAPAPSPAAGTAAPAAQAPAATSAAPAAKPADTPAPAAPTPKKGGILRYGLSTDPPHLDPHVSSGYAADLVKGTIYGLLIRPGLKLELVPDLAESWERPDDKTYIFHLRKNVKWHDGTDFTSGDVKATLERILDPKTGAGARTPLRAIKTVEATDPLTVKVSLSGPDASFLNALMSPSVIIAQKALIDKGADLKTQVIGTGPFKLVERQQGVSIKLTRNEQYYVPDRVYLDGITFTPYPDDTARTSALRTGAVDMIDYVPWKDMAAISNDKSLALYSDKDGGMMWVEFRMDRPPLDNQKVRQAISLGIDRQAVLDTVFFSRGRLLGGLPTPPWMLSYSADRQSGYLTNVDKAKQLLAEAGFPNGFKTTMLSTSTYGMHKNTAEVVQASLRKIGIDMTLDLIEWGASVARYTKGDFEVHLQGGGIDLGDPAFLDGFYHSTGNTSRQMAFVDKQIDELLDKARSTYDAEGRKNVYREFEQRALDLSPLAWLNTREQGEAALTSVMNYVHMPGANRSQHKVVEVWLNK
ncbi:MAG: hypothetical protein HY331_07475 [Chloroflexi bacterium]|nr:hypothetical protein [Chloroflexota bacterium]